MKIRILSLGILLMLSLPTHFSFAGSALTEINYRHCQANHCYEIASSQGFRSQVDSSITAFEVGRLMIFPRAGSSEPNPVEVIEFQSSYVDTQSNTIVAKGIKNRSPYTSMLVLLNSGEFHFF